MLPIINASQEFCDFAELYISSFFFNKSLSNLAILLFFGSVFSGVDTDFH